MARLMGNYFNELPFRRQSAQLGKCRFMEASEFSDGVSALQGKRIVTVGSGAQGLNQALCLRDSGLDVGVALRAEAIEQKRESYQGAAAEKLEVGAIEDMVPKADLVLNLTPDKQHGAVVAQLMELMKKNACLSYSHGFNIVEEGQRVREDLSVIMVAPKGPGTELRQEYLRGFGIPTLIAVHEENDPRGEGLAIAKAYAVGLGSDRAGVLESSFIAELKSDLMGEQTILCGMLQAGSLLCYDRMIACGVEEDYAAGLVQFGWETIGEALKHGGLTNMMNRLSNVAKLKAVELSDELKGLMRPLYERHMDDILSGAFSAEMMSDWKADDKRLLAWRDAVAKTPFEQAKARDDIPEQAFFDHGVLMVAMTKAGVELAFEVMLESGVRDESAYYESLHEMPLIANLIGRSKLHEMNRVISDTAEYGCHLFSEACVPLLQDFMSGVDAELIGRGLSVEDDGVDNQRLIAVDKSIAEHPVERIGAQLRRHMTAMKKAI